MSTAQTNFDYFAAGLVRKPIDPARLEAAKRWYTSFAGRHAVVMDDRELIQIYEDLRCNC